MVLGTVGGGLMTARFSVFVAVLGAVDGSGRVSVDGSDESKVLGPVEAGLRGERRHDEGGCGWVLVLTCSRYRIGIYVHTPRSTSELPFSLSRV